LQLGRIITGSSFRYSRKQSVLGTRQRPELVDSGIFTYEKLTKMVVADGAERKRLAAIGIRRLMRESKLSQAPISNAIKGKPVKLQTLAIIRQAAASSKALASASRTR
jgi:hypothetical protein